MKIWEVIVFTRDKVSLLINWGFKNNCHLEPLLLLYASHTIGPIATKLWEVIVYTRAKVSLFTK